MNILIIDDQYDQLRGTFKFANSMNFNNTLEIKVVDRSQSVPWDTLSQYNVIFVDIKLVNRSEMDGLGIIQKINNDYNDQIPKVVILTGNTKIEERMNQAGIPNSIKVLKKPVNFQDVSEMIQSIING